jgi:SAM-dependent methyltransferase
VNQRVIVVRQFREAAMLHFALTSVRPQEISLAEVQTFVNRHLPRRGARILEVGCGRGELAQRLTGNGHRLVGVDASAERVAAAKQRGVDARLADWPDFVEKPFDTVLFTRSLHHMPDIDTALDRAAELISDGGRLLLDEFCYDAMTVETSRWFGQLVDALVDTRAITLLENSTVREFQRSGWDLFWWNRDHEREVAPLDEMRASLVSRFRIVQETRVPYLYRELSAALPDDEASGRIVQRVFEAEARAGAAESIALVGWRVVAEPRARD